MEEEDAERFQQSFVGRRMCDSVSEAIESLPRLIAAPMRDGWSVSRHRREVGMRRKIHHITVNPAIGNAAGGSGRLKQRRWLHWCRRGSDAETMSTKVTKRKEMASVASVMQEKGGVVGETMKTRCE
ncbi:hypothetical protein L2E82_16472 [Cichorium intybus]|uniref:Uncharacterized protein n=1 Tax=Cichorium intybus TaxID=13427 RepID=A0ACB9F681_CICIN|nr:hypothetical protein L2E82_16472 [Cichorium intybus]